MLLARRSMNACTALRRKASTQLILHRPPQSDDQQPELLSDPVQRVRLAKLCHSEDDLAAAVATLGLLLLQRLDREERPA